MAWREYLGYTYGLLEQKKNGKEGKGKERFYW